MIKVYYVPVLMSMCIFYNKFASFYDSTILENHVPSITSLAFDAKELGKVACRTLLDLVEGLEVKQKTLLPYEVVLKESTK